MVPSGSSAGSYSKGSDLKPLINYSHVMYMKQNNNKKERYISSSLPGVSGHQLVKFCSISVSTVSSLLCSSCPSPSSPWVSRLGQSARAAAGSGARPRPHPGPSLALDALQHYKCIVRRHFKTSLRSAPRSREEKRSCSPL